MEDLKKFVEKQVKKIMLESELAKVEKQLKFIKEAEEVSETPNYQSNVYESYKKDLEEVVNSLAEACNKLESAALKQESHVNNLPEVTERMDEGKKSKQIILEIFKEVKKAKLMAERKLYEL